MFEILKSSHHLIPQIDIFSFLFSMIFNSMYHRIKNFWKVIVWPYLEKEVIAFAKIEMK